MGGLLGEGQRKDRDPPMGTRAKEEKERDWRCTKPTFYKEA